MSSLQKALNTFLALRTSLSDSSMIHFLLIKILGQEKLRYLSKSSHLYSSRCSLEAEPVLYQILNRKVMHLSQRPVSVSFGLR